MSLMMHLYFAIPRSLRQLNCIDISVMRITVYAKYWGKSCYLSTSTAVDGSAGPPAVVSMTITRNICVIEMGLQNHNRHLPNLHFRLKHRLEGLGRCIWYQSVIPECPATCTNCIAFGSWKDYTGNYQYIMYIPFIHCGTTHVGQRSRNRWRLTSVWTRSDGPRSIGKFYVVTICLICLWSGVNLGIRAETLSITFHYYSIRVRNSNGTSSDEELLQENILSTWWFDTTTEFENIFYTTK